ncbi:Ferredoxin--NADP reductase [Planctomycetes bacterium Pla163]|uniref:Ferredoxin--NADP reductase n=1 Tax=Rohdeia mirabilis TaxID=2528008 RepID=A0A518D3V4_9BACT|nr:Ferredoxin--NADP reductase [Planctomycetes bacterium Pla163]
MGWTVLIGLVSILGVALFGVVAQRRARRGEHGTLVERRRAEHTGAAKAELQHPVVDLSNCLGCGSCVRACPEEGVLELLHGQAVVVRGSGCVGTAACARECPTGAITVTLTDLSTRRDVPVLGEGLEAVGQEGLFLAGEVTAHALVKTAVDHGVLVAGEVAERIDELDACGALDDDPDLLDLVIVGAGPGGLACALEAQRVGLRFCVIEREHDVGGTVARYPRRKLVATQPIDLPLHGRLAARTYLKEELIDLWRSLVVDHELPVETGVTFEGVTRDADGLFSVAVSGVGGSDGVRRARHVCLAIGRRGLPRRLDVPGEELGKVAYSLLDADAYQSRRILVVGGGDSAVEAALGLTARGANEVTLSYRRPDFFRLKPSNERRLAEAMASGRVRVLFESEVVAIEEGLVRLTVPAGRANGGVGGGASVPSLVPGGPGRAPLETTSTSAAPGSLAASSTSAASRPFEASNTGAGPRSFDASDPSVGRGPSGAANTSTAPGSLAASSTSAASGPFEAPSAGAGPRSLEASNSNAGRGPGGAANASAAPGSLAPSSASSAPRSIAIATATAATRVEVLLRNDDVFVMAGGTPPIAQLEAAGVSFDPTLRAPAPELGEQGTGLARALGAGLAVALFGLAFALWHRDYYLLPMLERATHHKHDLLRPGLGLGLWLGIGSIALITANLAYLVRRSPRFRFQFGSLANWMTVHVATGVLALLTAVMHSGLEARDTPGGHALWALVAIFATGVVGRYLYAWVPRAANGRELELAEVNGRLARLAEGLDRVDPRLAALVRDEIGGLVERRQWRTSLPARLLALVGAESGLRRLVRRVREEGAASGLAADQIDEVVALARRAHRSALATAHLDDLRGLMASWRWLHRWGAVLLVALIGLHVVYALAYGAHLFGGGGR